MQQGFGPAPFRHLLRDGAEVRFTARRQGFVALNSQPIESVKEYQAITLLAPAQFGRNIGAQVNAVSKSGGSATHGTLYGFFNSSQLNARNAFDTANGGSDPLAAFSSTTRRFAT